MFCKSKKCDNTCPAYISLEFAETQCEIINAQLAAEEAKKKAYRAMERYWDNK